MALTDLAIKRALPGPKIIKLSDGGGLQLWITPDGAKRCDSLTASGALRRRSQ